MTQLSYEICQKEKDVIKGGVRITMKVVNGLSEELKLRNKVLE